MIHVELRRAGGTARKFRTGLVVALMFISGAGGAAAQDYNPHRLNDTVSIHGERLKIDPNIRVQPGASRLKNRAISTPFRDVGRLCMWHHDPGGPQPHFMQSGTCPAPSGARIGDFCECRAHGDQHRGYIGGRVVAGRADGKPPPLH